MTSFIGREESLQDVRDLLGTARLITITGPGGIGKTRLALEVADRASRAFADGAAVVELAALEDGLEVASAVAVALGVKHQSADSPAEHIIQYLVGRRVLLVVDNCEHVVDAVAELLSTLFEGAGGLTVLATSREPLGLPGERVRPLGPLSLPSGRRRNDAAAVDGSEAVRLLVERARAFAPGFEVTDDNRDAVVELCERLDGMPLAIELASVRLRSLSVQQVLERLDERSSMLTSVNRTEPFRHRTLWNLVDWSHDLCSPEESLVWARMSVFPGTFDLEAAEAVCGDEQVPPASVLDIVDRLVAKSIVIAEPHGAVMRYRMLVTIRAYGAGLLDDRGEWSATKRRHRDHYLARTATVVEQWCGPLQSQRLMEMRRGHPNLLAALEWSVATPGETQVAATLGSLLRFHWHAGGNLSDGRRWLDRILALDERPTPERGDALWVAAWVCTVQGDQEAAAQYLAACRDLAAVLDDELLRARADQWTGLLQLFTGDLDDSIASYRAAATVLEKHGEVAAVQMVLFQMAHAETYNGAPDSGLATCERVLAISRERGEQWCRAYTHWVAGLCHRHRGEPEAALAAAKEALELQREFQDGVCVGLTVELMSWLACEAGDLERSAELAGAASAVWLQHGAAIAAFGPHLNHDSKTVAREIEEGLGLAAADRIRSAQLGLTRLEVVELALGDRPAALRRRHDTGPLTRREFEVAQLIADGLSNRGIAERLVISPRTVDGHVERILHKLAYTSRTQVASWATARAASA